MKNQDVITNTNKTNNEVDEKINALFPKKPYSTQLTIAR
jgi:hypothetical protein